jgi:ParB family transcriptional regulator, chromosome partitioning protein
MAKQPSGVPASTVVPTGELVHLRPADVKPNPANPRLLFDPEPMKDLKENIRLHGVLVPITVFPLPGSEKFGILDGARRHRCCTELEDEGLAISIPANVVQPPDRMAGLLYMFSIHNFREQWELMPTALSLQIVMEDLEETDTKKLSHLTGLSEPQVERCKLLLEVPRRFQELSLDPNPKLRIPSNFWIEAHPVMEIIDAEVPSLMKRHGRGGILDKLVEKYRQKRIKSVIHFRRIVEAYEIANEEEESRAAVLERLAQYVEDTQLETRRAFDEFIVDNRKAQAAMRACETFIGQITRARIEHTIDADREQLIAELRRVRALVDGLLVGMEGSDPPAEAIQHDGDNE